MSEFVVGLTGGIGSGKTSVSNLFAQKGIVVVDADVIAREVVEPGSLGLQKIRERFGANVLLPNGTLNRQALREQVFSSDEDKQWLNALLHPMIREQMLLQTQSAQSLYCILSVPLLIENKLHTMVDRVLVVDLEEDIQLERALARDTTIDKDLSIRERQQAEQKAKTTIQSIMKSQCSRQQRLAVADDVVNNSKSKDLLYEQVEQLHSHYMQLASKNM